MISRTTVTVGKLNVGNCRRVSPLSDVKWLIGAIKGVKWLVGVERKMLVDHLMAKIKQSNWVISRGKVTSGFLSIMKRKSREAASAKSVEAVPA